MAEKNKVIKSVSFNKTVTEDVAMMKFFKRKNFSGYVKKLIADDMKSKVVEAVEAQVHAEPEKPVIPSPREQLERLKQNKRNEVIANPAPPKLILPKP